MDCDVVVDRMAALLDEELAPGEVELVGRHLEGCPSCAALLDRMAAQEFPRPELVRTDAPDFWAPMDAALDRAWAEREAEQAAAAAPVAGPAAPPWYRRELRLSAGLALLYAAALLLTVGLAGAWYQQATAARAEVATLQEAVEARTRVATTPAALPTEPVGLVSHAPYRGSL